MTDDFQLLQRFATNGDEDAFRQLIERHLNLVYSAAFRQLAGDAHLAQDVTQMVFTVLARKAGNLSSNVVLAGWLHQATRFAAAKTIRTERRRRGREQEAFAMQETSSPSSTTDWETLGPELDSAIGKLKATDRDALLLRFFERKEFSLVGEVLGVSEVAAQKRVSRALEKLRVILCRRGITLSSIALAAAVTESAVQAAPAGLTATVATISLGAASAATTGLVAKVMEFFLATKGAFVAGGVATAVIVGFVAVNAGNGQSPATPANVAAAPTNQFQPLTLTRFYNRLFASYAPDNSWGAMPRGVVEFEGVPFRMFGKIDLTGLGRVRDGEFQPTRFGEVPVGQRATQLHLLHGASYDSPDDTPVACVLLHYDNGEDRKLFIRYGVHVRNWYVEATERTASLRDSRSTIVWNGLSSTNVDAKPTRLFKTTFDNPLPAQKIRSMEVLSLFARANSIIVAITLEDSPDKAFRPAPAATDEADDSPYRREMLVRTLDKITGQAISNAVLNVTVSEQPREFKFGRYTPNAHGQILLDYPPGKFPMLNLRATAPGYFPATDSQMNDEGIFPAEVVLRLNPVPRPIVSATNRPNTNVAPAQPPQLIPNTPTP
jgi:RNA polymerase sigma factor (sigma-70 family)